MALLKVVDSWKFVIDDGLKSVGVFLDLRKAFGVIKHGPFGVPQRSVLVPTLFNIHINNVSKACHNSDVALFAEHTEIHFSLR